MITKNKNRDTFRRQLFSIQTDFSKVKPLVQSSKNLALNAELNAARLGADGNAFGVVARELGGIMKSLEDLVSEQQNIFRDISRLTAKWMKSEHRDTLFERAQSVAKQGEKARPSSLPVIQEGGALIPWESQSASPAAAESEAHAFQGMLGDIRTQEQAAIKDSLSVIKFNTRKIEKLVEKMGWIATRQGHFTAITANVEAARSESSRHVLGPVAMSIREFANTLMTAELDLRKSITEVIHQGGI